MTRKNGNLYLLLDNVTDWNDKLQSDTEDWLNTYCSREQLIKIVDRSGKHWLAPASRPDPNKAVLAFEIVKNLSPLELLAAWRTVMQQEAESAAAFDRFFKL